LEQVRPDLLKALEKAPEHGSVGIIITFHAGHIHKISIHEESIRLEAKEHAG
jgi:hypothetical protein